MSVVDELKVRVERYEAITGEALKQVQIIANKGTKEYELAEKFIKIAQDYYSDAKFYANKGDNITALAAFSYAHAWLDAGIKAGFLKGENKRLFMQP